MIKEKIIYIGDDTYFFPSYSIEDAAKLYKGLYPTWSDKRFENLKEVFKSDFNVYFIVYIIEYFKSKRYNI